MNLILSCSDQINLETIDRAITKLEKTREVNKIIFYSLPDENLKQFIDKYKDKSLVICLDGDENKTTSRQIFKELGIKEFFDDIPENSHYVVKDIPDSTNNVFINVKGFYNVDLYLFLDYENEIDGLNITVLFESNGSKKLKVYSCEEYLIIENLHYKHGSFHKYLLDIGLFSQKLTCQSYVDLNSNKEIKIARGKRPTIIEIPKKEVVVLQQKK